jgi:hypothetical protein
MGDVLSRPFGRLVVGHGEPLAANGREALQAPTPGCAADGRPS